MNQTKHDYSRVITLLEKYELEKLAWLIDDAVGDVLHNSLKKGNEKGKAAERIAALNQLSGALKDVLVDEYLTKCREKGEL